ncbi:MAG: DUF4115 domain-containing protein [Syntrophorhabdaceae bacterium]|nr:DUF4115 domain-containing protein [Syntrophorhabdaceae bacterium]
MAGYPFNLKEIGTILKKAREEKNITIDNISDLMCIKKSIIASIEQGVWDNLPHEVYTRGYIKQYASYLGVSREIEPYLKARNSQGEIDIKKEKNKTKKDRRTISNLTRKRHRAIFIYGAIILFFIGYLVFENKERGYKEVTPNKENVIKPVKNELEKENKSDTPFVSMQKILTITCNERTWVSVIIDGKEKKEFMLKPQEVVILNGIEKFDLLIGNAGGVKLFLNGKDTGFTGEKGQVKRFQIS